MGADDLFGNDFTPFKACHERIYLGLLSGCPETLYKRVKRASVPKVMLRLKTTLGKHSIHQYFWQFSKCELIYTLFDTAFYNLAIRVSGYKN
jgi:hypothetical protein